MKYLIVDAEMGGRTLDFSLLQAYFLVLNDQFVPLGELELLVKPDDEVYTVSGEGMEVNGIDIAKHNKLAIPYKKAKPLLYDFLKKHANGGHLTPVGHAVKGDIAHFLKYLISEGSWEQFCTYHFIDTSVLLQFLRACGKMPMDCDGSVGALANHFGCQVFPENFHDAKYDAQLTAKVFECMVELGR
jgi:hypothetical protein